MQAGAGCPACRKLTSLADLPTLAAQYEGLEPPETVAYGAHTRVPWLCRTWAVDPETGLWEKVEHRFEAEVKSRALQQDGCLVCAGYVIDATNSLQRWFPELAEQLDDPGLNPAVMSTTAHNASRRTQRAGEDAYQKVWWSCRHGHRWKATVLNRVRGEDCGKCSTAGISKEQVRLAAELAFLFDLQEPSVRDPRLPDGVPDYASHQLPIPQGLKPAQWRYRDVEVDIMLRLTRVGATVGVEYDGAFHHSSVLRQAHNRRDEREKSQVLVRAGLLDLMVHVRLGGLEPLESERLVSVAVPDRAGPWEQAGAVAKALCERFPGACPELDAYLAGGVGRAQHQADAYITAVWGQLKLPRIPRPRSEPKPRALRATAPAEGSWLTAVGAPYRNPDKPSEIVRDYECRCGQRVTRVQAQVTSSNTNSCGCRRAETTRRSRTHVSPDETRAVRAWAHEHGHPVGSAGRVPGRYTASYRLAHAGRTDFLGTDSLLTETPVRAWAEQEGLLGARKRITGEIWLHYTAHILNSETSQPSEAVQTLLFQADLP
ncbi:zinc-ribbon domain-containing protein [Streptomyces sp. NPDC008240]|uniref:zinc-ribbon domain-containing protein n=1 Tax=Streptomyces sp. NPDC008240 TaxID=3364822 RepID=UPI0036E5FFA4